MAMRIYNSLTQQKEPFEPLVPGRVGMYVCGPTVYKPSHIGHAVGPIIFDAFKRYLRRKGYQVTWVVNITDVDDKLIAEAAAQGCRVDELARRVTEGYLAALQALNVTGIDHMPRASEHIPEIIDICRRLIDRGAAYVSGGDVYFDVTADEDYGKLSHRRAEDQLAGLRELTGQEKRHAGDFALWKAAKPDEPPEVQFDSPWGKGRPGWHIECTAMSVRYLGESFDIHGGGMDLIFPHHENEIAQSETCFGRPFAKYWMHNGLTRFNTKKISKSDPQMARLMEQLVLSRLLEKYSGELLRFFVLATHYRRPIDFSDEEMAARQKGLESFYRLFERAARISGRDPYAGGETLEQAGPAAAAGFEAFAEACANHQRRFFEQMDDDFNTGGAIGVLFELATTINRFMDEQRAETTSDQRVRRLASAAVQTLRELGGILGLFERPPARPAAAVDALVGELMELLIAVRAEARKTRQFALSDMIRDRLAGHGIRLEDRPEGTVWRREG